MWQKHIGVVVLLLVTAFGNGARDRPRSNVQAAIAVQEQDSMVVPSQTASTRCRPVPTALLPHELQDSKALDDICWDDDADVVLKSRLYADDDFKIFATHNNGVPEGVQCEQAEWCDAQKICSTVCKRGTVFVDPWLQRALDTQLRLARRLPLCYATLPGTHNSGINLADGYGNRDKYFQQYFKWIKFVHYADTLHTNNQWFSLTDQLNMGARVIELDTHWVLEELRIAHCGGLHLPALNRLIEAVNLLAKLFNEEIVWDSETLGCSPSLSSIPADEQRSFLSALTEVRQWMYAPEHTNEFLVLYLDDELDLLTWNKIPMLFDQIHSVFPANEIFTPKEQRTVMNGAWVSVDELVSTYGKRVMFVSARDYGDTTADDLFVRGRICDWTEPGVHSVAAPPACAFRHRNGNYDGTLEGQIVRINSCALQYGPFNCGFAVGSNIPMLDETMQAISQCAVNIPSPDLLTPELAAAQVWSWAPGHPRQTSEKSCVAIHAVDGRWYSVDCDGGGLLLACRTGGAVQGSWQLAVDTAAGCPEGFQPDVPHHARDNLALQQLLLDSNVESALLPLYGPQFDIPVVPSLDTVAS